MMPPFSLSYLGPDYEWDVGHFEGAQRPNVDCFRSTSFGLSGEVILRYSVGWVLLVCKCKLFATNRTFNPTIVLEIAGVGSSEWRRQREDGYTDVLHRRDKV